MTKCNAGTQPGSYGDEGHQVGEGETQHLPCGYSAVPV